jgi:hypothetical protein
MSYDRDDEFLASLLEEELVEIDVLFWMFSTGFFHHLCKSSHHCNSTADSKSMQVVPLSCCPKSDAMNFYCPHTNQLYISSDYGEKHT